MKLSLEEARKLATQGKLSVTPDGFLTDESYMCLALAEVDLDPPCVGAAMANAALLAHVWNRFDELVAALEDVLFQFDGTGHETDKDRECIERAAAVLERAKTVEMP